MGKRVVMGPINRNLEMLAGFLIPDRLYNNFRFLKHFGRFPNYKNPTSLNEKIQWLKLYDRDPQKTFCADKILVRKYAIEKIGKDISVPLLFHSDNLDDLTQEVLPDIPFVIKTNHDTGSVYVFDNKSDCDLENLKFLLKRHLDRNYFYKSREFQYKRIHRQFLIEEKLVSKDGEGLIEYDFHCSKGKVLFLTYDNTKNKVRQRKVLNEDYSDAGFTYSYRSKAAEYKGALVKPKNFDRMLDYAKKLSQDFLYVRVDFYYESDEIFLGELTFHPGGGLSRFVPNSFDYSLGEKIKLPLSL